MWLALFACLLAASPSGTQKGSELYLPGTYRGVGEGMHGDITVETTFTPFRIVSIVVVDHQEIPGLADAAVARIPAAVISAQKSDVDAVSGATSTSEGIISAVQSTMSQALRK
jgi:uncharacterized protein with FMN-binding domain